MEKVTLREMLGIQQPVLVAPMFLISNATMTKAALDAGATAAIPALNYRTDEALRQAIGDIRKHSSKPFGFNLIVNKSNPKYKAQLNTLCEMKVDYIITSLGSPEEVIKRCKPLGIKVFCDVVNLEYARKVETLGADALIAVGSEAGGHCGPLSNKLLVPQLVANCHIPVIAAGGVGKAEHIRELMAMGAAGVSVGTIFIASDEAPVSEAYKQALVDYGSRDIILSTKLSGSHLTVINTPYVQKIGTKAGWIEKLMKRNKWLKKYLKMFVFVRGMRRIEKAAFSATYQTVWVAGPSIEFIENVRPLRKIMEELTSGL